jgi:hypothetical protein
MAVGCAVAGCCTLVVDCTGAGCCTVAVYCTGAGCCTVAVWGWCFNWSRCVLSGLSGFVVVVAAACAYNLVGSGAALGECA